jgi:hypothetical protein
MRALLLRLLWRAFGPVPAFAVSTLVFAALHLANPGATVLAGATVAVAGLMFCALFALTGRIWVPIGLHLARNFAQGYLFGATVSGNNPGGSIAVSTARPGAEAWLTGGTFGPEASVFALLLVSSVTVGALSLARKTGRLAVRPQLPPRPTQSSAQAPDSAGTGCEQPLSPPGSPGCPRRRSGVLAPVGPTPRRCGLSRMARRPDERGSDQA